MRDLPNINDEPAMLLRGKRSALASARNDAAEELRDACTAVQAADWQELSMASNRAVTAAVQLMRIATLWDELA